MLVMSEVFAICNRNCQYFSPVSRRRRNRDGQNLGRCSKYGEEVLSTSSLCFDALDQGHAQTGYFSTPQGQITDSELLDLSHGW